MSTETQIKSTDEELVDEMADEADVDNDYIRRSVEFQNADEAFSERNRSQDTEDTSWRPTVSGVVLSIVNFFVLYNVDYPSRATVSEFNWDEYNEKVTLEFEPLGDTNVEGNEKTFHYRDASERAELSRLLRYLRLPTDKPSQLATTKLPIRTYCILDRIDSPRCELDIPPAAPGLIPDFLSKRFSRRLKLFGARPTFDDYGTNRRFYLFWSTLLLAITAAAFQITPTSFEIVTVAYGLTFAMAGLTGLLFAAIYIGILARSLLVKIEEALFKPN